MTEKTVNVQFKIGIDNSTALEQIAYNSKTGVLSVRFVGGNEYDYVGPQVHDVMNLVADAVYYNSWGKAWNQWSRARDMKRLETVNSELENLVETMSLADIQRVRQHLDKAEKDLVASEQIGGLNRRFYK